MKDISPVKIFVPYWIFSLFLYAYGPLAWVTYRPLLFWGLNVVYIVAFVLGWNGSKKIVTGDSYKWTELENSILLRRIGPLLFINLFYQIVNLYRALGLPSYNVPILIDSLKYALTHRAETYNLFQANINAEGSTVAGGYIITGFNYVWEIWAFTTFLLGIILFKRLKIHQKVLVTVTVALEFVSYLARGTRIGLFRVLLIFVVLYYIDFLRKTGKQANNEYAKQIKMIVFSACSIVLAVVFFNKARGTGGLKSVFDMDSFNVSGVPVDSESIFFNIVPEGFYGSFTSIASYLTQGYYGMSLAMRLTLCPMWGIGGSMALWNLLRNFDPHITDSSYQVRGEQYFGWESYGNWHSMYTWFANDLSFYGVIFVMLLFGFFFQKAIHDAVELNNPYAKVMVYLFFLMALFVPGNNQIAQQFAVLFGFVYSFIHWQLSKRHIMII